jgi:hypothetical protein
MEPGETQTILLESAATQLAESDPNTAIQWADEIDDKSLREKTIGAVAVGYATQDPSAAADWAINSLEQGDELNQAVANVTGIWVREFNATDTAEWVSGLPEGTVRQAALTQLIKGWNETDPPAVATWVEQLAEGALKKQAQDDLANTILPSSGMISH